MPCFNLSLELSPTFSKWFHHRSLPQLKTRYSRKVVKDLMNCLLLDKNKLQPKATLDKELETSPGRHNRFLNCQLAMECINSCTPMCTHAQENIHNHNLLKKSSQI
jgi:hypothetical protein